MKTVAIVGAGASGLAAIKCCLEDGLEPVCFERTSALGGMWYYTDEVRPGQACCMKTTVANTSKEFTCFCDYPVPDHFPNFLHNTKILEYLRMYATHFKLIDHIRFNVEVLSVKRADDYDTNGRWAVETYNRATKEHASAIYDAVLVANGHHAEPNKPNLAGQDVFRGKIIHSLEYRNHQGYEDKRVVVIGLGNSAGDAAVELSRIAKQVYMSTRRGSWIVDRLGNRGFPIDLLGVRRCIFALIPLIPRRCFDWLVEAKVNSKFHHASYSLRPAHRFSAQHPTVNDELPNRIICGSVIVKPDVARLTETGVKFTDGTCASDIDVVICATGYLVTFPFIDENIICVRENVVDLYRRMFPPELRHPTLAVIGALQQLGSAFPLIEMQCRWANKVFKGECQLPNKQTMWKDINERKRELEACRLHTLRHTMEVEWLPYMDELANEIGCKPNIWRMLFYDPLLALKCVFGPCTPYQFRLVGPGRWCEARDTIFTTWQRVLRPLRTRQLDIAEDNTSWMSSCIRFFIIGSIICLLVAIYM